MSSFQSFTFFILILVGSNLDSFDCCSHSFHVLFLSRLLCYHYDQINHSLNIRTYYDQNRDRETKGGNTPA